MQKFVAARAGQEPSPKAAFRVGVLVSSNARAETISSFIRSFCRFRSVTTSRLGSGRLTSRSISSSRPRCRVRRVSIRSCSDIAPPVPTDQARAYANAVWSRPPSGICCRFRATLFGQRPKMVTMAEKQRIVVGISGASGVIYGVRLLELLRRDAGRDPSRDEPRRRGHGGLRDRSQSGRRSTRWRIRCTPSATSPPRSPPARSRPWAWSSRPARSAACREIASGVTSSLLTRAADVILKERRPAGPDGARDAAASRPSAHHGGAAEMGAVIAPPVPAFYSRPQSSRI